MSFTSQAGGCGAAQACGLLCRGASDTTAGRQGAARRAAGEGPAPWPCVRCPCVDVTACGAAHVSITCASALFVRKGSLGGGPSPRLVVRQFAWPWSQQLGAAPLAGFAPSASPRH